MGKNIRKNENAALMYLHEGEPTGKKGRPRKYDGKIDFDNIDMQKFSQVHIYADKAASTPPLYIPSPSSAT